MKTTTDEMIQALVLKGFKLPEGLEWAPSDYGMHAWLCVQKLPMAVAGLPDLSVVVLSNQHAHDMIAMHFARQMDDDTRDFDDHTTETLDAAEFCVEWSQFMGYGDSATAVKVLWEAVCGG